MRMYSPFGSGARGVTLTELMVAMGLSVMLLGGVATMFVSSRATYLSSERLARIEENGRFALDSIQRDLRGAGFVGCSQRAQVHNVLNAAKDPTTGDLIPGSLWNLQEGVRAHNALSGSSWTPALISGQTDTPLNGSDVLVMHSPAPANTTAYLLAPIINPTDDILVKQYPTGNGVFRDKQIIMLSSCTHSTIFEISVYNAKTGTITHKASTYDSKAATPGNRVDSLEWTYDKYDTLVRLQTVTYYVKDIGGVPTLIRRVDNGPHEALVDNVEMMQVKFGYDTDGDRMSNDSVDPSTATTPDKIVSATIGLLVRSPEKFNDAASRTYNVLDTAVTKTDGYMYKVFTTTVLIRNTAR